MFNKRLKYMPIYARSEGMHKSSDEVSGRAKEIHKLVDNFKLISCQVPMKTCSQYRKT